MIYTSLESLIRDKLIPENPTDDVLYYDIGKIKINTKSYDLKYIKTIKDDEEEGQIAIHNLVFFDHNTIKKISLL